MAASDAVGGGFTPAYLAARSGATRPRATPADAFAAACETYLSGERLDMGELAAKLGVGRSTLYRWCGDRERLLSDVIWSVTEEVTRGFQAATGQLRGTDRVRHGVGLFMEYVAKEPALRALLRNETHTALRLVTARGDGRSLHDRLVAQLARQIKAENEREDMHLRASPELVASTIVRVMEGFIYNDAIAAVEPQVERAAAIVALLLESRPT
jgi:AcrR family transcriptional regulator